MFRRETLSLSLRPVLVLSKIFSSFLASFLPAKIPYLSIKKNDNKKRDGKKRNSKKRKERKENVYFVVRNIRVSFFFFFVNGRTIIKIVMAKQEKEERLIRDGRISMFVLGTSRWRGRSYRACSLH